MIFKILICYIFVSSFTSIAEAGWKRLDRGLYFGEFKSPQISEIGDSMVRVLRINTKYYRLGLFNASEPGQGHLLTAKQWCQKNGLIAAINSSMYREDYKTSVSYMRTKDFTNNSRLSKDKTILAFHPKKKGVPEVKMIDRECENFKTWKNNYHSFVQSIRMISCKGKNVWVQQSEKWSTAAIGTDNKNRILFIHVQSPFTTHDFINILQKLPLGIKRAMYVEGGPEAQLYIKNGKSEYEFTGISNRAVVNANGISWPIPNVVGVIKKE